MKKRTASNRENRASCRPHHDIHVMDAEGARLASRRLPEGLAGIGGFHQLVAAHGDDPAEVVIGIETDRGLWVEALSAAGYQVFAVNPFAVARYRDRHTGASSTDVFVLLLPSPDDGNGLARLAHDAEVGGAPPPHGVGGQHDERLADVRLGGRARPTT